MGSQDVASDMALLKTNGITHILNVGFGIPCFFPDTFNYRVLELLDVPPEDTGRGESQLQSAILQSYEFISAASDIKDAKVFVHCNAGVSRAATITIGFLMMSEKMSFSQAFNYVKAKRQCIRPNDVFVAFLRKFESQVI